MLAIGLNGGAVLTALVGEDCDEGSGQSAGVQFMAPMPAWCATDSVEGEVVWALACGALRAPRLQPELVPGEHGVLDVRWLNDDVGTSREPAVRHKYTDSGSDEAIVDEIAAAASSCTCGATQRVGHAISGPPGSS